MKAVNVTEQLGAAQRMFLPTSEISETMRNNARAFWENQDRILDAMRTFADGWFERRHAGAHAALEAANRMCKAETPVELAREYQEWASGALQRVAADGLACQQELMAISGALVPASRDDDPATAAPRTEAPTSDRFRTA